MAKRCQYTTKQVKYKIVTMSQCMLHVIAENPEVKHVATEVRKACAAQIAKHKIPRYIWLLDEPIPRNANGKFLKRELRETLKVAEAE